MDQRAGRRLALPRSRLACALLPGREVLGHARPELLAARRLAVDIDQAERARDPPEQSEAIALRLARRVGVVTEIDVLRLGVDRLVDHGRSRQTERVLADSLGQLIEAIAHRPHADTPTENAQEFSRGRRSIAASLLPRHRR